MARAPVSKRAQASPPITPHPLWQSLTHPEDTFWAWTGGTAPWIPWLERAQSWSCGISCKESQARKDPGPLPCSEGGTA